MKSPIRIYHENSQGTSMNSNEKEFLLSSLISEAPSAPYCFYSAVHCCQPFFNLGSFGALRMANLRLSQLVANSTNFSYTCNNYCENHS